MSRGQLTPKQEAFVHEYLVDLNATQAAIRAGYSPRTARAQGHRLLTDADIAAAIEAAQAERSERLRLTADDVLRGLHEEATFVGEGSSHSARVQAWAHIGKHLGMFVDKHEHTGPGGSPLPVAVNVYLPSNGRDVEGEGDGK